MAEPIDISHRRRAEEPTPLELARQGTRAAGTGAAAGAVIGLMIGAASGAIAGVFAWSMSTLSREVWRRYQKR